MVQCTAKSKNSGERCRRQASAGKEVCIMHGANGGRPVTHGLYSKVIKESLREKLQAAEQMESPLDATQELALTRSLLTDFLERVTESGYELTSEANSHILFIVESVSKQIDRIIKQRNETALTTAEVKAIKAGMESLVNEFVPADKRRDFVQRLRALIPG
jgi:hypothetical protein